MAERDVSLMHSRMVGSVHFGSVDSGMRGFGAGHMGGGRR